jgi:hypothetical protein
LRFLTKRILAEEEHVSTYPGNATDSATQAYGVVWRLQSTTEDRGAVEANTPVSFGGELPAHSQGGVELKKSGRGRERHPGGRVNEGGREEGGERERERGKEEAERERRPPARSGLDPLSLRIQNCRQARNWQRK